MQEVAFGEGTRPLFAEMRQGREEMEEMGDQICEFGQSRFGPETPQALRTYVALQGCIRKRRRVADWDN